VARATEAEEITQVSQASQVFAIDHERALMRDALERDQRAVARAARTRTMMLEYLILRCPEDSWPSRRRSR
jgi:hypothetical protein